MPVLNDPAPRIMDGGEGGSISPELSSALRFFPPGFLPPQAFFAGDAAQRPSPQPAELAP